MTGKTINRRTRNFKKLFEDLPAQVQELAREQFRRFCDQPCDPSLRLHRLEDNERGSHLEESWSVAIGLQYRAIYVVRGNMNVWYWIGTHADYDRFTGEK